ncbi:Ppx/GppA phosphatase family protein [Halanaerobium congolense]|mgnify:CR=1 FL=1|uniref:Ppx/GppA phosphatase family protein n=1 Tax=Halanaerobium congolense TaxID=54121 RepID=UPI0008836F6D|nr:Ppx/GppA phosphatase family protein [Halanaerobium congolense]SDH76937.1 exopolyphosphatase / guanosine-5'-triphosphate,3'-diphosphate pyrophosphatase [Halanaerobium congolense]
MRAAAIDIGTNSCRLLIAEKKANKSLDVLSRKLEITRLGEGVDQNRFLKEEAVNRVYKALEKYKKTIDKFQVDKIRVVGTSALRDVENPHLLTDKIKKLDLVLEIISGEKEAELNYLGAVSNLDEDFLLIDIGGGSTEFIWPTTSDINFKSLDIGCVRMTEKFISDPKKKIRSLEQKEIQSYVENLLKQKLDLNKKFKVKGVGGTITTVAAVKLALEEYDSSKIENLRLEYFELENILNRFADLDLKTRKKIKGLQPKRADVITAGLIILKTILNYLNVQELYVSDHDLLYGLLKNELLIK